MGFLANICTAMLCNQQKLPVKNHILSFARTERKILRTDWWLRSCLLLESKIFRSEGMQFSRLSILIRFFPCIFQGF
jgi:hypothetical protein